MGNPQNFSFILGLPPYLIFTDSLSTPPTHELLMRSAGFINNNIVILIIIKHQNHFSFLVAIHGLQLQV